MTNNVCQLPLIIGDSDLQFQHLNKIYGRKEVKFNIADDSITKIGGHVYWIRDKEQGNKYNYMYFCKSKTILKTGRHISPIA